MQVHIDEMAEQAEDVSLSSENDCLFLLILTSFAQHSGSDWPVQSILLK